MEKIFEGKQALVVGGTGGIGGALALVLAEQGAQMNVVGGSSAERLMRTERALAKHGAGARCVAIQLADEDATAQILAFCPRTDILICAHGPFLRKPLAETSGADWRRIVTMNLILPGTLVSAYLGGMIERAWGRILLFGGTNTASVRGFTTTTPYSASKTALGVLAKSLAKNAAGCGVCCNVICPGLTNTEYMDEESMRYNRENAPGGKVLTPAEIASFALDILKNPALNGGIFPIDHGIELYRV
ncbi:MAG: SDR family oxidoreductase [Spirochaetaceae bacterium]|jgi:NAD(P)-dependent dehydrogenase (short-subunit alcohol dehydrogenase family)|nr:SDR family oxidoreductase [Spirochaetaceae bacterium]